MSADGVGLPSHEAGLPAQAIPGQLASVLAPLDRRAFGVAIGVVCALAIFLLTAVDLVLRPEPSLNLELLRNYFLGYSVSWTGALVGAGWAFGVGFCAGWTLALARNLVIALWIFIIRGRHEIAATRDFLDHV